jgi:epoxyqueuosine reductase
VLSSAAIKAQAFELGFDLCGIAPAAGFPELARLREWIERGYAGEMHYMARSASRRVDVRSVLPSARSVIVTATNYNVDRAYSTEWCEVSQASIARYAWGDDYHGKVGERLEALLEWMRDQHPPPFEARAYVDTGPIQERVYAQHAGIGWIGKNTCVISPEIGSWIFLGEIVCSLALEPDPPAVDQCGTCTLCLEACPTGAIVEPWLLDATRCLSYLTIELKGTIPDDQRDVLGNHVFGCDICQEVCPWNATAKVSHDRAWQPRPSFDRPRLVNLWMRSDDELDAMTQGSPLTRPKLRGLRRNLAVALGNSRETAAARTLDMARADASFQDPIVADHVAWAVRKLRDSGSGIGDSDRPIGFPNPEPPIPNPQSRIPNPKSRTPNPESPTPNPQKSSHD